MSCVEVCELFTSLQGESSWAGYPCFFVRMAGCNLRCRYCDASYACGPGHWMSVADVVAQASASSASLVTLTGGEPLLQEGFTDLAARLSTLPRKRVLVETNGSLDIRRVPEGVIAIVDVKCPGSAMEGSFDRDNLDRLRPYDEVKFVLTDARDYAWACAFMEHYRLTSRCHAVLFSPACGYLDERLLAAWIVRDGVEARLHIPLHTIVGLP